MHFRNVPVCAARDAELFGSYPNDFARRATKKMFSIALVYRCSCCSPATRYVALCVAGLAGIEQAGNSAVK
jgi:hypothetical protein